MSILASSMQYGLSMRCHRIALLALAASCSAANTVVPSGDPFAGTYTLATVAKVSVPGTISIDTTTGGSTFIRSGSIAFVDAHHLVFSLASETRATGTSSPVSVSQATTFAIGRLPTQAFVIDEQNPSDTVAVITIPSSGRLAWDFLGVGGSGTYLFTR
jgi:hypothetical protein